MEQSGAIFGLTTVLSSKQIYNVKEQIQEDSVENLSFFVNLSMTSIRAASIHRATTCGLSRSESCELPSNDANNDVSAASIRRATTVSCEPSNDANNDVKCPFQKLTFLVRDWPYYESEWTFEECREQMRDHLKRHLDPQTVVESSTVEELNKMFAEIDCCCLPHPGFVMERATWGGNPNDIEHDFFFFLDWFVRDVFTATLQPKEVLGSQLTTSTFTPILETFVTAFERAPTPVTFTQAMVSSTVLLAKDKSLTKYREKMEQSMRGISGGLPDFDAKADEVLSEIKRLHDRFPIFGPKGTRDDAWTELEAILLEERGRYKLSNNRLLEMVFAPLTTISVLAVLFWLVDRLSDFTCDWWSQRCVVLSSMLFFADVFIAVFVAVKVGFVWKERGNLATWCALTQLGFLMWEQVSTTVKAVPEKIRPKKTKHD